MHGFEIRELGSESYLELQKIWAGSVKSTHDFLKPQDFESINSRIAKDYFPVVRLFGAFQRPYAKNNPCLGFAGLSPNVQQNTICVEMLFVDAAWHGKGIGKTLLDHAKTLADLILLDVNEQNTGALAFYLKQGFHIVGRSPLDAEGKAYPLLHLAYSA